MNCSEEIHLRHGQRLLQMIQCETVSVKDQHEDGEFAKLRQVVEELFPLLHQKMTRHIFGADCWMYCLPGRDASRNLMLMSHHDVVAAEGQWNHGKYGEIAEGKLWGRGTVDTKTPLYAEMEALEQLLQEGYEPPCNIWIGSSHNEETAGDGVPKARDYFVEHGIRFEVILDEGGAVIDPPIGGMKCRKCAMVAVHEMGKQYLDLKATEGNGHTALTAASKASPVERITAVVQELAKGECFVRRLNEPVKAMFRHLAPHCKFPLNMVFGNLWLFGGVLKRVMPKLSPQAGAMIGTTCVPKEIHGSQKEKQCTAMVLMRPVDAEDWQQDLAKIRNLAERYQVEVSIRENSEYQNPADMSRPAFAYTMNQIRKQFPDYPDAPMILPAGTDARTLTDVCDCVLRFAPIELSAAQLASVHAEDENIDLSAITQAVAFYESFLREYA